ncbi:PspC domain-containing protein [Bacillus sp. J14TS2]
MNNRKLRKSSTDKALYGVCGGIAEFLGYHLWSLGCYSFLSSLLLY